MSSEYGINDQARLISTFTDINGNLSDPTAVTLTVRDPSGVETTYTWVSNAIVRDSLGVFHYDLLVTLAGIYDYRWAGTGAVQVESEGSLTVSSSILVGPPPPLATDLTTLGACKDWLQIGTSGLNGVGDRLLQRLITSCSLDILAKMSRKSILQTAVTERRNGNGNSQMTVHYWPIISVQSVSVNGVAFSPSPDGVQAGYRFDDFAIYIIGTPYNSALAYSPFFVKGQQNVALGYTYGYPTVPYDVEQACIELVSLKATIGRTKIGLRTESLAGIGTTSYITSAVPDSVKAVVNTYKIQMLPA